MKRIIFLYFLLPTIGFAQTNSDLRDICFIENSEVILLGNSNVTDYSCKLYDLSNNSHISIKSEVYGHTIKLENAVISLKSNGFECDNKIMTKDFYKTIKGAQFPEIKVEFLQFTLVQDIAKYQIQKDIPAKLLIQLAGKSNQYSTLLKSFSIHSNQLTMSGSIEVLMTDFDIDPPTALFGAVKTDDEIQVDFNITFTFK